MVPDARVWNVGGRASCQVCDWYSEGKNALGTGSQHAKQTGHEVRGEIEKAFDVFPEGER
jgi:hypothetical protein